MMTFHELLKLRLAEKRAELNRMRHVVEVLTKYTDDYEISPNSYLTGFERMMAADKAKLITQLTTEADVIFYNEVS